MSSYTIASPLAMAASVGAGLLSTLLLVEPAFHDGFTGRVLVHVTVSIGLVSMAIVTGVLAHGHRHSLAGLALAVVSASLSLGIVWEQYGRRAQSINTTQTTAGDTAKERARLTKLRAEADEILTTHRAAQAKECASGKGKRCDGISYTVRTWEAAVAGYDAKLRAVPATTGNAKVENVGIMARLLGHNPENARTWATLVDPALIPMLLELAAILCGIVAVTVVPCTAPVSTVLQSSFQPETLVDRAVPRPVQATRETPKIPHLSPVRVETDEARILRALRAKGGQIHAQNALGIVVGVSKGEVSKMLRNCPNVERFRVDNRYVIRIKEA